MKRMKRIAAGAASLAMVASMALSMPLGASAATAYTGLISTTNTNGTSAATASSDHSNTISLSGVNFNGTANSTLTSYNATEFKKVLEIEDTANIPSVTFNYAVTVPTEELPATYDGNTLKTLAVFKGINADKIAYKLEDVSGNAFGNASGSYVDPSAGSNFSTTNDSSAHTSNFVVKYSAQTLLGNTGNISNAVESGGTTLAAGAPAISDNVVINNVAGSAGTDDTYYAIKTVQMDFSACEFKEPGIYRYYIEETGANQGVTNDYPNLDNSGAEVANTTRWRTIDVYVEDATYSYTASGESAPTTVNALSIAGYVMYVGKQTEGPAAGAATNDSPSADIMEDGLTHTNPSGNGGANGVEVASATKSEGILNKYDTSDIKFSKKVTGNQASKDKFFKFTVTLTDDTATGTGVPTVTNVANTDMFAITGNWEKTVSEGSFTNGTSGAPNAATVYTAEEISNASNSSVTTATANTAYGNNVVWLTGEQLKAGYSFYLQDGDDITIHGLPNGIGYTIAEYQDDYQPAVTLKDANDGFDNMNGAADDNSAVELAIANVAGNITSDTATATITDTKIEDDVDAAFTNTRKGTIPTGILLSVAAPAGVGAVVIGGIAYLIVKNRRREAEEE